MSREGVLRPGRVIRLQGGAEVGMESVKATAHIATIQMRKASLRPEYCKNRAKLDSMGISGRHFAGGCRIVAIVKMRCCGLMEWSVARPTFLHSPVRIEQPIFRHLPGKRVLPHMPGGPAIHRKGQPALERAVASRPVQLPGEPLQSPYPRSTHGQCRSSRSR
jgi:hypothetical protein